MGFIIAVVIGVLAYNLSHLNYQQTTKRQFSLANITNHVSDIKKLSRIYSIKYSIAYNFLLFLLLTIFVVETRYN